MTATAPKKLEIKTDDGVCPAHVYGADGAIRPGVILFPDAGSVRPAMDEVASRLAALGYVVLLPHIFYRAGEYAPFDPMTVFTNPAERERLMTLVRSLDLASAMRDAGHFIRMLREQPGVAPGPLGAFGYCIGGRLTFATAGSYASEIGAAAAIHGGGLANDAPDSPHLAATKIKASLYFGIADEDPSCTPEQQGKLVTALAGAHVQFTVDHFKGRKHGFAVKDFPVYDAAAHDTHWSRIVELFKTSLRGA